jgi:hypothetical protein
VQFVIGDAVVVWRAWAIWVGKKWVVYVLFILWLGNAGACFGIAAWSSIAYNIQ